MNNIAVVITTYNSAEYINNLLESIENQDRDDMYVILSDDGSTDKTIDILNDFQTRYGLCKVLSLPHKERGYARSMAIKLAMEAGPEYLMILDADMSLESRLVDECMELMTQDKEIGALVLKEIPFSTYDNPMTRVKLFERTILNNSSRKLDRNSIEAARFWRTKEYLKSGGINPLQIAFEETQPTIRYIESGGVIIKHTGRGLYHDEKKVTLKNILSKKKYHFMVMNKTFDSEENGMLKAFRRWYFFRPVMYKKDNLKLYVRHPLLTIGMVTMYLLLTFIGCLEILKNKIKTA